MKIHYYLFLGSLLLGSLTACETSTHETTKELPVSTTATSVEPVPLVDAPPAGKDWQNSATAFIQPEQTLLQEIESDLNNDGIVDKVIVLENPASTTSKENLSPPRSLIILQGNPQGAYRLWASSDKVILCAQCGGVTGDPFRTIEIEEAIIVIQQDGGSREQWERNSNLALDPASEEWMIVKDVLKVVDTYDASNNRERNILLDKQLYLEQYDVYKDQ